MFAGIDTHKDTLAVAVIDSAGRQLTVEEVPNTTAGLGRLAAVLERHEVSRVEIEGSGTWGRGAAAPGSPRAACRSSRCRPR